MSDTKQTETMICCGQPVRRTRFKDTGTYAISCSICRKYAEADSPEEVEAQFKALGLTPALPAKPQELPSYVAAKVDELRQMTVPFVARDKPALTRLIKNNIRYVMNRTDEAFLKAWKTQEGQESIVHAIEEAMSLGAELGKTGSLVPFGSVVEFIPAVEAYEFALTNGSNPPFTWIQINMIHENDIHEISQINGEFSCKINPGVPRGELVAVAVYGMNTRLGKVIGEVYDKSRLLEKARIHSASYQYYLKDVSAFAKARTEGKVQRDGGREYIVTPIKKRDGGTWNKKVYLDEISNPYEGADQPEMLRKAAGKSFLGKYARVRNSEAAIQEVSGDDPGSVDAMIDRTLDVAMANLEAEPEETTDVEREVKAKASDAPDFDPEPDEPAGEEPTEADIVGELVEGDDEAADQKDLDIF